MRHVSYIVAAAGLALALAGCADPYYPRYGTSQSYYAPSGYTYAPADYRYAPSGYASCRRATAATARGPTTTATTTASTPRRSGPFPKPARSIFLCISRRMSSGA